jgi:hypothetical protein
VFSEKALLYRKTGALFFISAGCEFQIADSKFQIAD